MAESLAPTNSAPFYVASPRWHRGDALALSVLVASAVLIATPILSVGYGTFFDNAVHLAEIRALAEGEMWSEIGFAGFPLGDLHSPLWYGLLAGLVRVGISADAVYAGALLLGFLAPSVALYKVARRRMGVLPAAVLAYLLLVQRPVLFGYAAFLGGMWTYALGCGALVLFADRLGREPSTSRNRWALCCLLAVIGLTHLFVLVGAVLLIAVWTAEGLYTKRIQMIDLLPYGALFGLAALASAAYWVPSLELLSTGTGSQQALLPLALLMRLLFPTNIMPLLHGDVGGGLDLGLWLSDAVPMTGLIVLGLASFAIVGRKSRDLLPKLGLLFAVVVFFLLLIAPFFYEPLLGPVSWRFIYLVRLGAALSAISLLAQAGRSRGLIRAPLGVGCALLAILLSVWWGTPLRDAHSDALHAALGERAALDSWIVGNARPEWGRIYFQDTFLEVPGNDALGRTHAPILAARSLSNPMLGTYYGIVPYASRWTLSEGKLLFGSPDFDAQFLRQAMRVTNTGVLVVAHKTTRDRLESLGGFETLHEQGRYSVWKSLEGFGGWAMSNSRDLQVSGASREPGAFVLDVASRSNAGSLLVSTSFHPGWVIEGLPGAKLRPGAGGMIEVTGIPPGRHEFKLRWEKGTGASISTWLGWAILIGWGLREVRSDAGVRSRSSV